MAEEMIRVTRPGGPVFLSWTTWLSPWGGHETSPWHYVGGSYAANRYARRMGRRPKNDVGRTLFPTHAGPMIAWARSRVDADLVAAYPRYHPRWMTWVARVPGRCARWRCGTWSSCSRCADVTASSEGAAHDVRLAPRPRVAPAPVAGPARRRRPRLPRGRPQHRPGQGHRRHQAGPDRARWPSSNGPFTSGTPRAAPGSSRTRRTATFPDGPVLRGCARDGLPAWVCSGSGGPSSCVSLRGFPLLARRIGIGTTGPGSSPASDSPSHPTC